MVNDGDKVFKRVGKLARPLRCVAPFSVKRMKWQVSQSREACRPLMWALKWLKDVGNSVKRIVRPPIKQRQVRFLNGEHRAEKDVGKLHE